jgi:hypothetical protein
MSFCWSVGSTEFLDTEIDNILSIVIDNWYHNYCTGNYGPVPYVVWALAFYFLAPGGDIMGLAGKPSLAPLYGRRYASKIDTIGLKKP